MEGRALELTRRKRRSLLALLLLNAGEVVSTDRLVEELWAGKPPKAAIGSLQNLVSDLRKVLGHETVLTREPGYVLDINPSCVDLHVFERLVAQAAEGGDAGRRSALLHEALALWRGPPLADLAFEPFANVEIARMEELRTTAREELIESELELGRHAQVVSELEALVAENPLRERLRGQLMLALYRSGRQAEALEAYRGARETLVDELGIEPSPELQRLEQSILRHDPELELPQTPTDSDVVGEERRKTVTVLFADIVDFTSLGAALDPEVLRSIMRRYFSIVRTVVERHGGTIEKFIGDAAMAVFGVPQVHEDDALRAARTATDLQDALVGLNTELVRDHGLALQIRTGINTGEVLTGDAAAGQPFATGAAVTMAMRLQQAALPGETLLGEVTRALLADTVESEPVEPIEAGSALGPLYAYRLITLSEADGLRLHRGTPFVGRQTELAFLQDAYRSVLDQRHARVLVVLGEAGVGKTRLASEFTSSFGTEADTLVGRCTSYGEGATYLPLAEIVRQIAPERPQATIARLLEGDEHGPVVAERIVELTGQGEGSAPTGELFWAVRRLFEALARRRPLVVVFEDVHWAEETLVDLIEYLTTWRVEAPLLVVCLARPELHEERPGLAGEAATLRLEPLAEADAEALIGELGAELPTETRTRILTIAEGNPFFVEQLLAYIDEAGAAALESVPPSIEALLASRLDRLTQEQRALLERAAVAGREFRRAAVLQLSPPDEVAGADRMLMALAQRGLIRAVRSRVGPDDRFRFHHVLIRDVAYAGMTKEARSDLHERFAGWLEQREQGAEEIVGYHLEQAYRYRSELLPADEGLADLAHRAGSRLGTAGIRAWKRADTPAAVNLLARATSLLPDHEPSRAELLCELGIAERYAGQTDAGEERLREAIETASKRGERRVELRGRVELAHARLFSDPESRAAEMLELAARAIPVFEEVEDDRALGRTWRHVGYVRGGMQSRHEAWREASEQALVHYLRSGWSPSGCLVELAASLYYGPVPAAQAIGRCNELLEESTERVSRAHVLAFLGGLEALDGRLDEGRAKVEEASTIYQELGEGLARANNAGRILGHIELLAGNLATAEAVLRDCCETFERANNQAALSSVSSDLAQALYAQQRVAQARAIAARAEGCAPRDDVAAQFAWRAVSAKLLAQEGVPDRAESLVLEAVSLVDSTDSPCQRADVLLDLAEVKRLGEKPEEAVQAVEGAIGLYGLKGDVPSSLRAQALLDELAVA